MTEPILAALLITTNTAWMIFTHRLINKLMSRNYHEYIQAMTPPSDIPKEPVLNEPAVDLGPLSEF